MKNNIFTFHNKSYKQIRGTAIGTQIAPTYANLILAYLEEKFLYWKIETNFGSMIANDFIAQLKRFLDDMFIIIIIIIINLYFV